MSIFVKICGITSEEDALGAIAMGADALGFVFAPSTRQIDRVTATEIVRRLPQGVLNVGVFQNHSKENVVRIATQVGLKAVQLHGLETPEDTKWIKDRVPYVIKSFVSGSLHLPDAKKWRASAILIDSHTPGSGKVFNWAEAENAPAGIKILLAGGLTVENVGEAIERVKPWGVDTSTGVELSPGKKDMSAIRDFVAAAKSTAIRVEASESSLATQTSSSSEPKPFNWETDLKSLI